MDKKLYILTTLTAFIVMLIGGFLAVSTAAAQAQPPAEVKSYDDIANSNLILIAVNKEGKVILYRPTPDAKHSPCVTFIPEGFSHPAAEHFSINMLIFR